MSEFDPKEFIASLPRRPGVYRMFGAGHELLYVGKARSLRDRVGTYFAPRNVDPKVQALTAQIEGVEVTVTNSETEALLLEYNLIKAHKPRFNVVLRDDKSFPYIHLYVEHEFPRLEFYRGAKSAPGRYFGPFPSAGAVRDTLNQLQKLFRIRNCRDSFFANRSRPCLQHQIGRCSAPCVGLIPRDAYAQDIAAAVKVLEGRSDEVNAELEKAASRSELLSERTGERVEVRHPVRGLAARWVELTRENAVQALRMRLAQRAGLDEMFSDLASMLDLPEPPSRIECFDISHTGGEGTVASCVVFGPDGPLKKEYRRFNITAVTPGDDYGALRQALERRYRHVRAGEVSPPDLLLIDGGAGQVSQVHAVLAELGYGDLTLVGIAKGPERRVGHERLFVYGAAAPVTPEGHSPAARLIQRIRDEAHRFAITGHRRKRARRYNESVLEVVPGLGPARRRALLKHFGGLQGVMRAGVADLTQVAGIGATLARSVYDHLHPGS